MPHGKVLTLTTGSSEHWTDAQRRFLAVFAEEANRTKPIAEVCRLAGYKTRAAWQAATQDLHFLERLDELGVRVKRYSAAHTEVSLAADPEEELAKDVWDVRRLKAEYPKHATPGFYRVDFRFIQNPLLRRQVKLYFRLHLTKWKARTFRDELIRLRPSVAALPAEVHAGNMQREHIEALLPKMAQLSEHQASRTLHSLKAMLNYMATSKAWSGPRPPRFLVWPEDIPVRPDTMPRPIPPDVVEQLDTLLEEAVGCMAEGKAPPALAPVFWDAILILRRTGMRYEDLAHLIAPNAQDRDGCLDCDPEGYWWVRIQHTNTKMNRDHRIPTKQADGVVDAVRRQRERAAAVTDHFGKNYLFRTEKGVLGHKAVQVALGQLGSILTHDGEPYRIAPHQFRHTIATDMIEQGVDIYTVKEFLGHTSLRMTEKYVKVYLQSLKAKYDAYRNKQQPTYAAVIADGMDRTAVSFGAEEDNGWVEEKVGKLYRSPLPNGMGVCVHLPMVDPCPTPPVCGFCSKLRVEKRHVPLWETALQNHQRTLEILAQNPEKHDRAIQRHQPYLRKAQQIVETVRREGFYDGRIHNI